MTSRVRVVWHEAPHVVPPDKTCEWGWIEGARFLFLGYKVASNVGIIPSSQSGPLHAWRNNASSNAWRPF